MMISGSETTEGIFHPSRSDLRFSVAHHTHVDISVALNKHIHTFRARSSIGE